MLRFRLILLVSMICAGYSAHFLYPTVVGAYSREGGDLSWSWSGVSPQVTSNEELADGAYYECK